MAKDKLVIGYLTHVLKLYKRKGTDRVLFFTAGKDLRKLIGNEKPEALLKGAKIFIIIEKAVKQPIVRKKDEKNKR